MKWINLTAAALGTVCLLASAAWAQHGPSRYQENTRDAHRRGSEVTLYRDAVRHSSSRPSVYQTAGRHPDYGHSSRYSHHGRHSYHGHSSHYRPNYYRPPVIVTPPVIVAPPCYARQRYVPEPYYYPRRSVGYNGPGFSIGIGF